MAPKSHIRSGGFCRSRRVITPATSPSHSRNTWPVSASAASTTARLAFSSITSPGRNSRAWSPKSTLGKVVPSDPASDRARPSARRAPRGRACAATRGLRLPADFHRARPAARPGRWPRGCARTSDSGARRSRVRGSTLGAMPSLVDDWIVGSPLLVPIGPWAYPGRLGSLLKSSGAGR